MSKEDDLDPSRQSDGAPPEPVDEPRVGSSFGQIEEDPEPATAVSFDSLITGAKSDSDSEPQNLAEKKPRKPRKVKPEKPKSGSLKPLLISAGVLVLVVLLGFFGLMGWDAYQEQKAIEKQQAQEEQEDREKAKAIREADNPFSVLVGEVDPPSEEPLSSTVEADQLKIGESSLTVRGGALTATVNGCTLGPITDICPAARGQLGDGDFTVLIVKDISRTRFLDDPVEFKEFETGSKTIAASLAIDMGNSEGAARFGVLTANGTTGFVLMFPDGTSASRVDEVLKASTVIG